MEIPCRCSSYRGYIVQNTGLVSGMIYNAYFFLPSPICTA
uniref:Uncharacterized protein n=1 Tax=Anguilla anguilla TaxID=7936 RepID=A0A0E9VMM6_ANGAN